MQLVGFSCNKQVNPVRLYSQKTHSTKFPRNTLNLFLSSGATDPPTPVPFSATIEMTVAYAIIFLVGFLGNITVIHIVATRNYMKTTFNFLIVNMAVGDLLVSLFIMPASVKYFYFGITWIGGGLGSVTCKFVYFAGYISIAASIITLVFISLDRYFAVLKPFVHVPVLRNTKIVTSVIWVSSGLYMSPYIALFDSVLNPNDGKYYCRMSWDIFADTEMEQFKIARSYFLVSLVLLYAVPLVIIAFLYLLIGRYLWAHEIPGNITAINKRQAAKSKRKVLRMLTVVVVVFTLCWLPTHVMHTLTYFTPEVFRALPAYVEPAFYFLSHANSAINPCLFLLLNNRFNQEFRNVLRCGFGKKHRELSRSSASTHSTVRRPTAGTSV